MDENTAVVVNIEEIMREIRQSILTSHAQTTASGEPLIDIGGQNLPPAFYEHLYEAGLTYNEIGVKLFVSPSNLPIFGGLIDKLRHKIHELVIFYVNQVAERQIEVNYHLLRAISILGQEVERQQTESEF